jgi:hypothetical protein
MKIKKPLPALPFLSGLRIHKGKIIVLSLFSVFCMSFSLILTHPTPPADCTGSPSDASVCTDCHADVLNSGPGVAIITSNIPSCGYVPSTTYSITVSITEAPKVRFEFELSPQKASTGAYLGTLIAGSGTSLLGTKDITGNTDVAGSASWTFTWTAPATGLGPVTFYGAFNASDGDGDDQNGDHIYTKSLTVPEAGPYSATITSTNPNCNSLCTGTATANAICGTAPYTYAWNTSPAQTTQTATGLCAGSYTVLVIDASTATKTATVTITQPTALTASVSSTDQTSTTPVNGTASVAPSGGTAPYTYAWSTTPVQTTATATGLTGIATYTVAVTDSKSCAKTYTVTVGNTVGMISADVLNSATAYPNPTNGDFFLEINSMTAGEYVLMVMDITGKMIYSEEIVVTKGQNIKPVSLKGQGKGVFFIELRSASGAIKVVPVAKTE